MKFSPRTTSIPAPGRLTPHAMIVVCSKPRLPRQCSSLALTSPPPARKPATYPLFARKWRMNSASMSSAGAGDPAHVSPVRVGLRPSGYIERRRMMVTKMTIPSHYRNDRRHISAASHPQSEAPRTHKSPAMSLTPNPARHASLSERTCPHAPRTSVVANRGIARRLGSCRRAARPSRRALLYARPRSGRQGVPAW